MTHIKITCGCNTTENPVVFTNIQDAENHAEKTGHTLTITGTVTSSTRRA